MQGTSEQEKSVEPSTTPEEWAKQAASATLAADVLAYSAHLYGNCQNNTYEGTRNFVPPFESLNLVKGSAYSCPVCGVTFQNKTKFRTHYMIHTGEKPFQCPHCSYKCRQNYSLQMHIKNQHETDN